MRGVKIALVAASLLTLAPLSVSAQPSNPGENATELDRITVSGIRGSLQSSMALKRDASGIIDGIVAEEIGKFPDTNLAESLQRISGVAIDRTDSGEGSKVSVRGIAPDYNLVLLNGRQMPATSLPSGGYGISGSRAFDFATLASEAISQLQVYKTTRANTPSGGIGATLDIRTARALDRPGLQANLAIKGMHDTSVRNLPRSYPGHSLTPEVSALYSQTFADGRFGIAASASYQARDSGYSFVHVPGWSVLRGDDASNRNRLPLPEEPAFADYAIENRPKPGDIYARPVFMSYAVNAVQRQRRNGQVSMQFAPLDTLTATLDYTAADHRIQRERDELQMAFSAAPGASRWTDGPVAAPIVYSEYIPANNGLVPFSRVNVMTRSELQSRGFNLEWQANESLDLVLDYHDSISEIRPDNPLGSSYFLGTSTFVSGDVSVDFSRPLPILTIKPAPGVAQIEPAHAVLSNSGFRKGYQRSEVKQAQFDGTFRFSIDHALAFGLADTDAYNRAASSEHSNSEVDGVGTPDDYADDLWYTAQMGQYFKRFRGHNDPAFSDRFLIADMERLRARGIELRDEATYSPLPDYSNDLRTRERTRSGYLQWRTVFEWNIPVTLSAGLRHEKTEINSSAQILPPASNIIWQAENGFRMDMADTPVFETMTGQYSYWLPNLDLRADLRENLVLRASLGKSIARPGWDAIQGGLSVQGIYQRLGGMGNRGNPGLLPLVSRNVDLSGEWYYREGSYLSLGYFRKHIKNFIGNQISRETPYPIYTPVGGVWWNEAIALGGCGETSLVCIRDYIFSHHADKPGVEHTGQNAAGQHTGTITGQPGDPLAPFAITTPVNQRSDTVDGFEISLQHLFGDSGFGLNANYTKVNSRLRADNTSLAAQYPMLGLGDSANLVLFYEQHGWQVRAAYNLRDEFVSRIGGGSGGAVTNATYTERYAQLDVNVTYRVNAHLSVFVEGFNLTDATRRSWLRHPNMLAEASQTGPRYLFGARYRF